MIDSIPYLPDDLLVGLESFSEDMSKDAIRKTILEKRMRMCEVLACESSRDYFKIDAYRTNNLVHVYLDESNLYFDEYIRNFFLWLNNLNENDEVTIYYYASWKYEVRYILGISAVLNAFAHTKAKIISTIYNPISSLSAILALKIGRASCRERV